MTGMGAKQTVGPGLRRPSAPSGRRAEGQPQATALARPRAASRFFAAKSPVDHVRQIGVDEVRAAVLVVEVVGVLPEDQHEQRRAVTDHQAKQR